MPGARLLHSPEIPALVGEIAQLPRKENDVVLLLIAEHTTIDVHELWAALRQQQVPIAGGVFPGVIYDGQKYDSGVVADVLPLTAAPSVVKGLDTNNFQLNYFLNPTRDQKQTALVLIDGLTRHVALFLERLFKHLGNSVSYIGGGAGSLSFEQKPCLFDNEGIYQDAALILWLKTTTNLGVQHGWQRFRGPYVASQAQGTVVHRLNNQSAFQVYSRLIKQVTHETLTKDNFFSIAKEYPLGIYHPGMDYIVRDPIAFTEDGALVCVGEVPRNSLIYVLNGNRTSLIDHAKLAANEAIHNAPRGHHNLVVDCISRVLYLEDDFAMELAAVREVLPQDAPAPYGMLSLGEIASFATGRVEFFNKTIVVGSLQDVS